MPNKRNNRHGNVQDRIILTQKICQAVQVYNQHLVGKIFMYVFDNRCIEVIFRTKDFSHLTGVETNSYAKAFYKDAKNNKLRYQQFGFSRRHPYSLSVKKVDQLLQIDKVVTEDLLILETVQTQSATYKFGITEFQFTMCMDKDLDDNRVPKSDYYIAKSLRIEDSFNRSNDVFEVNLILSRKNNQSLYDTVNYSDGSVEFYDLPEPIRNKLNIPALLN